MVIVEELNKISGNLNQYQRQFILNTKDLFNQIPAKHLTEKSYVVFNYREKLLEISLEHVESPNIPVLFIIHPDMIEISCSEYIYFLDTMKGALFEDFSGVEFWKKVKDFVEAALKGYFWLILSYYKGETIKTEIVWKDNMYPSYYQSSTIFLYKKKHLVREHLYLKNFIT